MKEISDKIMEEEGTIDFLNTQINENKEKNQKEFAVSLCGLCLI